MDITASFRALVLHLEHPESPEGRHPGPERDKNRILRSSKPKDPLNQRAKDILRSVNQLKEFLLENRDRYLGTGSDSLGDLERDKIDNGANTFIRTCNGLIAKFKQDLKEQAESYAHLRLEHYKGVCDILNKCLKSACDIYSEQKAIRLQRDLEFRKLSRLEVNVRSNGEYEETLEDRAFKVKQKVLNEESEGETGSRPASPPPPPKTYNFSSDSDTDYDMSPEEIQVLEQENDQLYEELLGVQDAVQQIETKVVKIAELQEVFTEKVLQQKDDIDLIAQNAVNSTENVKDGNEELRKAIQNQASVRVYILFFLLVMSFALLFLDWYND